MIARLARTALLVTLLTAAGLIVATPAQAAAAQVTITTAISNSPNEVVVYGTATCADPSAAGSVFASGLQVMEFRYAADVTEFSCAAGPVAWSATLLHYPAWQMFRPVHFQAHLSEDGVGSASTSADMWV